MTAQELADECGIPLGNVPTIVNLMSRGGLLMSSPGRNGGCSLARSADSITTLEIIECLEGTFDISHCLLDSRRCHDKDPECAMHAAWKAGRDAAIGALGTTSLATVASREVELQGILVNPTARAEATKARPKQPSSTKAASVAAPRKRPAASKARQG